MNELNDLFSHYSLIHPFIACLVPSFHVELKPDSSFILDQIMQGNAKFAFFCENYGKPELQSILSPVCNSVKPICCLWDTVKAPNADSAPRSLDALCTFLPFFPFIASRSPRVRFGVREAARIVNFAGEPGAIERQKLAELLLHDAESNQLANPRRKSLHGRRCE